MKQNVKTKKTNQTNECTDLSLDAEAGVFEELPLDWENQFESDERAAVHVDSAADGLILSLTTLGRVDIEFIAAVTDTSYYNVLDALCGVIYQNPETWENCFYRGWETADEYLSGNLIRKWKKAKEANVTFHGRFESNLKALEALLPESVKTEEIYVTLGSPWLPCDVVDDFIEYLVGARFNAQRRKLFAVRHDEDTGLWEIPYKTRFRGTMHHFKSANVYGTSRMEMLYILENTLNMKTLTISDKVNSRLTKSGTVFVVNEKETYLALEKQKAILEEFRKWVWSDEERKERLQTIYDERYGSIRKRQFDGSFLTFPGMDPSVNLYPYQKNAIARILFTPNTLLAHDVGSGKTFVMIAAGMEMRRMGTSKKNLYVVPNNLVGQWKTIFLSLYPDANLLTVEPRQFTKPRRNEVMMKIRDGDYDGILMAYSCFDMLPLSEQFYGEIFGEEMDAIKKAAGAFYSSATFDRKEKAVFNAYEKTVEEIRKSGYVVFFDDLGINTIFLDEAHNYKNVPTDTKITHILGISKHGSEKCRGMMDKVHCIQRQNNGRGAVLATGTPITNSITDAYVMQRYLQSGELALLGLQNFDSWVGMFAEKHTDFEIDVDTGGYRLATRFSRFHNLPELTAILSSVADFHSTEDQEGLPRFDGYTDVSVHKTDTLTEYLKDISARADAIRARKVSRTEDNMLKITTDGKKAALDLRLIDPSHSFTFSSKVAKCADAVYDLYCKTAVLKSAQLVFCDSSTPKPDFNLYDELRRLLKGRGIPDEEIAYVHEATTEKKRLELFRSVQKGDIRVLIGSTFKLGLGVNVQERLVAIHHLDVPWRPADMVQREGRILRQGNTSDRVMIFRYITEGSFDAYSWQLLETKQRFISQLLSGSMMQRDGSDVDDTVLNYAEVKALAVGNPLVKQRVETANDLNKLYLLQREEVEKKDAVRRELADLPAKDERLTKLIRLCKNDIAFYNENKREYAKKDAKQIRERIDAAVRANFENPEETEILTYQGFRVIVPAYMKEDKPCVYLQRAGRYLVELGAESGVTRRLDFFLDELRRQMKGYQDARKQLRGRKQFLLEELEKDPAYTEQINEKKAELERIDEQLGVKKQ